MLELRYARPLSTDPLPESELLDLLGQLDANLEPFEFPEVRSALQAARLNPDDTEALFNAGYQLVDIGLHELALPVLARALRVSPRDHQSVTEMVSALEGCWAYHLAADFLKANQWALQQSEFCRCRLAHAAAMCGDLETTRGLLPSLTGTQPMAESMARTARARVARFDAVKPSVADPVLQDWEMVLNGALLLTCSGEDNDSEGTMHGRWAWAQEGPDQVAHRLDVLFGVLASIGRHPSRVVFAPDHDSEILGRVAATRFGIDVASAEAGGWAQGDLVVAYMWPGGDAKFVSDIGDEPDVTLYAHDLDWTAGCRPVPDTIGAETQYAKPPWGERLQVNNVSDSDARPEVVTVPADDRDAATIAGEIAVLASDAVDDEVALCLKLLGAVKDGGAPCGLLTGQRDYFFPGGPVASSRFV